MANVVLSWLTFYKKFPKAERYIFGLELSYDLAGKNFLDILIDFLRNFLLYKFHLPPAAQMVNVHDGVSSILVIFIAHISSAYLGLFKTIVFTNVFYLIGLVLFITVAAVRRIDNVFLFVALFFLAVGLSGREFLLELFLSDQHLRPSDPTVMEDEVHRVSWSWKPYVKLLLSSVLSIVVSLLIQTLLPVESSFSSAQTLLSVQTFVTVILVVAAAFTGFLWFLCGHSFYRKRQLTRGPLATTFRVFKAAIVHETNVKNSEVKEVKRLLTMFPMWALLIVYSLVEAAGSTFFLEQASEKSNIFLVIFVICQDLASLIASDMSKILPKLQFLKTRQRLATFVRIGIGMSCSLFCCIVACRVEKITLNTKSLRVLWLIPQFVFLGCMQGFAEKGVSEFFKTQVPGSMRDYGPAFNEFVLGIGKFISAILVVIFKDWFGEDLKRGGLGRYYEFLACLSLLNCFLFVFIAVWYFGKYQEEEMENLLPTSSLDKRVDQIQGSPLKLPKKSYSFPPQGSLLPSLRRFLSVDEMR